MKRYKGVILFVNDDTDWIQYIKEELTKEFYISFYTNGRSAIYAINNQGINYDLAIVDLSLPDISGVEVAEYSKKVNPKIPVIAFTCYDEIFKHADDLIITKGGCVTKKIKMMFKKYATKKSGGGKNENTFDG